MMVKAFGTVALSLITISSLFKSKYKSESQKQQESVRNKEKIKKVDSSLYLYEKFDYDRKEEDPDSGSLGQWHPYIGIIDESIASQYRIKVNNLVVELRHLKYGKDYDVEKGKVVFL